MKIDQLTKLWARVGCSFIFSVLILINKMYIFCVLCIAYLHFNFTLLHIVVFYNNNDDDTIDFLYRHAVVTSEAHPGFNFEFHFTLFARLSRSVH